MVVICCLVEGVCACFWCCQPACFAPVIVISLCEPYKHRHAQQALTLWMEGRSAAILLEVVMPCHMIITEASSLLLLTFGDP